MQTASGDLLRVLEVDTTSNLQSPRSNLADQLLIALPVKLSPGQTAPAHCHDKCLVRQNVGHISTPACALRIHHLSRRNHCGSIA